MACIFCFIHNLFLSLFFRQPANDDVLETFPHDVLVLLLYCLKINDGKYSSFNTIFPQAMLPSLPNMIRFGKTDESRHGNAIS